MIGAIAGDIIGSVYEWDNLKSKEFSLFAAKSRFTDDSVLTIALADSILTGTPYATNLKAYFHQYRGRGYGGSFRHWAQSEDAQPYNSWGNGAAMRISPVGYAFDDMPTVLQQAKAFTEITHNHPEGIKGAQAVAVAIFLARTGASKADISQNIEQQFGYDLSRHVDEIRPTYTFDVSSQGSVPQAIRAFLDSTDFEDAIRTAISLGGDSDTIASIAGGIAQAFYGGVPADIQSTSLSLLDEPLRRVTEQFMDKYGSPRVTSQPTQTHAMTASGVASMSDKYIGALLGLACGDALGTTLEFSARGSFAPLTDMVGGGPFKLEPGQWTDDTSMALCLGTSLVEKKGFDPLDQMQRYVNWWRQGYLSSTGDCFDIGLTVRSALRRFEATQEPYSGSTDPNSAGNGSLMRLVPIVLYAAKRPDQLHQLAANSSRTTHGTAEAIECCQLFAAILHGALMDKGAASNDKTVLLQHLPAEWQQPKVAALASGAFLQKTEAQLVGSGYCVQSLEAALWCFFHTHSYAEAVLRAVNLGDDADTTGAIVGQLAGVYYGAAAIPEKWAAQLAQRQAIEALALQLQAL